MSTDDGHSGRAHARLSPSSAERWIHCPASVRLTEELPPEEQNRDSEFAREGTAAHELAELTVALYFDLITPQEYQRKHAKWLVSAEAAGYDIDAMGDHVMDYLNFIKDAMMEYEDSQLLLERRVFTGVPHSWGTADAIIFSERHVHIIDFKYGMGVKVPAQDNPQLKLYALGAFDEYGTLFGEPEVVFASVFQPRMNNVATAQYTPGEILAWRESILPVARDAIEGSTVFGPSETACRWCPVAGRCKVRRDLMIEQDFGADPDLMDNAELGEAMQVVKDMRAWCDAVEATTRLNIFDAGKPVPGWKMVKGYSRRTISDTETAVARLEEAGFDKSDVVEVKLVSFKELEKLVGKTNVNDILGDAVVYRDNKPSLVPEDDPREAFSRVTSAAEDFSEDFAD